MKRLCCLVAHFSFGLVPASQLNVPTPLPANQSVDTSLPLDTGKKKFICSFILVLTEWTNYWLLYSFHTKKECKYCLSNLGWSFLWTRLFSIRYLLLISSCLLCGPSTCTRNNLQNRLAEMSLYLLTLYGSNQWDQSRGWTPWRTYRLPSRTVWMCSTSAAWSP